jgi:hypothetical protein
VFVGLMKNRPNSYYLLHSAMARSACFVQRRARTDGWLEVD